MAEETRRMKVEADINDAQITHVIDVLKTIFKEQSETERSTLAAEVNGKTQADEMQLRQAELAANIGTTSMANIVDMLNARLRADAEKAKLAAKTRGMN